MAIAVLVVVALSLVLTVYAVIKAERVRRSPRELRGDWWGRFERDFRAYTETVTPAGPTRMHRPDR